MNSLDTRFSKNVFEAVQKTRSTCFIGSKTTRLRLVVLNPIKHSCSFFKHYLKDLFHWRLCLSVQQAWEREWLRNRQSNRNRQSHFIGCLMWLTYDVCWKKLKGRKETVKIIFKEGHWRLQIVVSTIYENNWFASIILPWHRLRKSPVLFSQFVSDLRDSRDSVTNTPVKQTAKVCSSLMDNVKSPSTKKGLSPNSVEKMYQTC